MSEEVAADNNPPEAKKQKMSIEQSPDEEWPEGEQRREISRCRTADIVTVVKDSEFALEISPNHPVWSLLFSLVHGGRGSRRSKEGESSRTQQAR